MVHVTRFAVSHAVTPMTTVSSTIVNILAVSDVVDSRLYGGTSRALCGDRDAGPDLLLSCGDLPPYYLDYLISKLDVPMFAIHGNHDSPPAYGVPNEFEGCGASWIGGRGVRSRGLLIAGFDGCLRYNSGAYQASQTEMHAAVRRLVPWLLSNRLRFGRYLDILLTHAPPRGIHDEADQCHTGFDAFNWLIRAFRPRYHLHGHIHLYDRRTPTVTRVGETEVVNVYPFRELELALPVRS
jgi:Icc-related predicted phosphoesterase